MYQTDTIAAISTPIGEGGIGIVRLSGPEAFSIAEKVFSSSRKRELMRARSHSILHGYIKDPNTGDVVDEVLVSVMKCPHTYTREDVVEINCHSGAVPLKRMLELVLQSGARLAMPGEFTQRAFLNGRIDLIQAEAVMDIVTAKTDESSRIAVEQLSGGLSDEITRVRDMVTDACAHIEAYIDFPEDEIEPDSEGKIAQTIEDACARLEKLLRTFEEGKFFREGLSIAIVGKPNVGKSSLLNALLERDRVIVTEIPGTTRDVIEDYLNIQGLPVRIMDTAGIRQSHDLPEQEGVKRSLRAIEGADLVIAVFDASREFTEEDREVFDKIQKKNAIVILNKSDLSEAVSDEDIPESLTAVRVSAKYREGIEGIKDEIINRTLKGSYEQRETVMITNVRHKMSIETALDALTRAVEGFRRNQPLEIIAIDTREALQQLGEVVGVVTTDDILNKIFSEFCIGK